MAAEQRELQKNSVERTLCIPLWCRALAVEKLPQILPDHDAARILREMGETKPPTIFYRMECACLAGAIRQYDFAKEIEGYLAGHPRAVVVEMGAGRDAHGVSACRRAGERGSLLFAIRMPSKVTEFSVFLQTPPGAYLAVKSTITKDE